MGHNTYEENLKHLLAIRTGYTGGYFPSSIHLGDIDAASKFLVNRRRDPFRFNGLRGYFFDVELETSSESELEDMIDAFEGLSNPESGGWSHEQPMTSSLNDYDYKTNFTNRKTSTWYTTDNNATNGTITIVDYQNHLNAAKFDPTDDYGMTATYNLTTPLTQDLEFWFYLVDDGQSLQIFSIDATETYWCSFESTSVAGGSYAFDKNGYDDTDIDGALHGAWHHVRMDITKNATSYFYFDGILKDSFTCPNADFSKILISIASVNSNPIYLDGLGLGGDSIHEFGNLTGYNYPYYLYIRDKAPNFNTNTFKTTLECEARWSI